MPTLLAPLPTPPPADGPRRKRWTREECAKLEAAGILQSERLELIEGELIDKMGKHRPHANAGTLLWLWLVEIFGGRFVNSEVTIDVSPADNPTSEPEPDLIVLKRQFTTFKSNPQPEDIALLVEVADSTLRSDLTTKAALYARAGIAEYWVLDVAGRRLFCHREPVSGAYSTLTVYEEHEVVFPLAAPTAEFRPAIAFQE
jgi:Uma2 family endonuclease